MDLSLKILHTADWHIGHQLHGYHRNFEHQQFLDWLLEQLDIQQVDVLCVSGDIFDSATPSAQSWQQLYQFLADATRCCPGLQVIITAGNHDSPSKISAPSELLSNFDLHLIGQVYKDEQGVQQLNRLLIPMKKRSGEVLGWALAVPFLRASDLILDGQIGDGQLRWQKAIFELYHQLGKLADSVRQDGQMLLAMGHAHVRGGQISELSERQILLGGEHALPADVFPRHCDYVALGHLHLGQQIRCKLPMHYSGSPLPLSFAERRYHHHVQLLNWQNGHLSVEPLAVPRSCEMLQVPNQAKPLKEVLSELRNLPDLGPVSESSPYLEVQVFLDKPQAHLREQVMQVLADKGVRLTRIRSVYPQTEQSSEQPYMGKDLDDLSPQQVFELCYRRSYHAAPSKDLEQAFAQVVRQVEEMQ
ncbi:exonuclease SbcCD subunit D C-terminal domain-containing protein [Celerinatantimonas diazotrophica]|uniref:Nuclease SbcCD subunit D n=1 Tax=Celerinatantimonas diazotrophica TaxID=412034 RepID=A0A4R1JLJ9_9GAMM|nr:exonuclease SbcCD subunit D C-terminal domain-containing protein [Celerinatantimonas diazotrophica]TCK51935.1 exodeoxyribonuclease I subunit D [Celerinatantimonas diazotrophica]CAG9296366.1 Nuclease SbcCD subunit D [Celerinatantimonas diazotrophica]